MDVITLKRDLRFHENSKARDELLKGPYYPKSLSIDISTRKFVGEAPIAFQNATIN